VFFRRHVPKSIDKKWKCVLGFGVWKSRGFCERAREGFGGGGELRDLARKMSCCGVKCMVTELQRKWKRSIGKRRKEKNQSRSSVNWLADYGGLPEGRVGNKRSKVNEM
jgi:hypothetical protein